MTTVMSPVVATDRGVRRNDRPGHNRKGDKRKQQIAEHLHSAPLQTRPPNRPDGPRLVLLYVSKPIAPGEFYKVFPA